MPSPVPQAPSPNTLARMAVGNPASGSHVLRWAQDLAALCGFIEVPAIADLVLPAGGAGGTDTVRLTWVPSVGAAVLHVAVEFYQASAIAATCTVQVGLTGALSGATWIDAGGLDGTHTFVPLRRTLHNGYERVVGVLDVSAVTKGSAGDITITVANNANSTGLYRLTVRELPRAAFDPVGSPTTEPAVDASWATGGNEIVQGGASYGRGTYAVLRALESARKDLRAHLQIAGLEAANTARCPSVASAAFVNPNWALHTAVPTLRTRARALYGPSVANAGTVRIRYACSTSTAKGIIRFAVTPVGGATTNNDLTCNAGGTTAFQWASFSGVNLPASGTDQEVDIAIQAQVDVGTLYFPDICWYESES